MIAVTDPNNRDARQQTWAAIPRTGDEGGYPHQNGVNVVFCDGQVEKIKSRQFRNASDDFWKRWDRDHEPHPETWLVKSD